MAIYYLNAQIISRSAGRSATGAAAYRAGERIHDERTGQTYDYTRRQGDIETEILAPAGAPAWVQDRERLWNEVEKAERRGDSQVAREIVIAIPLELDRDQQKQLVRAYVQEQFVSKGMVADVAIHRNPGNPHAHILLTMREMGPEGLAAKKNRDWNKPELLEQWREQWAVHANRTLERAGRPERIDHRSLAEQGADRLPQVHLGPHAHALEQRGIPTEKGDHNRLVAEHNAVVIDLDKARAEKQALQAEKVMEERKAGRLKAGWHPEHADAMARVESQYGDQPGSGAELNKKYSELSEELRGITSQVRLIEDEGRRLTRAIRAFEDHREAMEQLRRHQGPLGVVRRLFSTGARQEYQHTVDHVKITANFMHVNGVNSEADLQQQLATWQHQQAQVTGLEGRAERLRTQMGDISLACRGLELEAARKRQARTRDEDWQHIRDRLEGRMQERSRDRTADRGR